MPIPFRDAADVAELGIAGYLKIEPADGPGYAGALLLIDARGEPIEFTYNRVDTPHRFLWRAGDVRRHAARQLAASIFALCAGSPRLLFCLADEVGRELFSEDLAVSVPVCRIAPGHAAPAPADLSWIPHPPPADAIEARLLEELTTRRLLLEPFERASAGLREVYGAPGGGSDGGSDAR